MLSKEDLFEIFSDIVDDDEKSVSDRIRAGEFLMKYHYANESEEKEGRIVIIDDIKEVQGDGG